MAEMDIWLQGIECRGTRDKAPKGAFLTSPSYPRLVMTAADALQISRNSYFSNLSSRSPRRTPRALAILAQVRMVGTRWWLSMKLIAGRLMPTFSAKASWDRPCSFRSRANSLTSFSINNSADLSLIGQ